MRKLTLALAFVAASLFQAATCPIDGNYAYFTGRTSIQSGKMLKEFQCSQGHTFWQVQ